MTLSRFLLSAAVSVIIIGAFPAYAQDTEAAAPTSGVVTEKPVAPVTKRPRIELHEDWRDEMAQKRTEDMKRRAEEKKAAAEQGVKTEQAMTDVTKEREAIAARAKQNAKERVQTRQERRTETKENVKENVKERKDTRTDRREDRKDKRDTRSQGAQ